LLSTLTGLKSIIFGFLFIRGMTMVCDPVHKPSEYESVYREIVSTNETMQKFEECMQIVAHNVLLMYLLKVQGTRNRFINIETTLRHG